MSIIKMDRHDSFVPISSPIPIDTTYRRRAGRGGHPGTRAERRRAARAGGSGCCSARGGSSSARDTTQHVMISLRTGSSSARLGTGAARHGTQRVYALYQCSRSRGIISAPWGRAWQSERRTKWRLRASAATGGLRVTRRMQIRCMQAVSLRRNCWRYRPSFDR